MPVIQRTIKLPGGEWIKVRLSSPSEHHLPHKASTKIDNNSILERKKPEKLRKTFFFVSAKTFSTFCFFGSSILQQQLFAEEVFHKDKK